MVDFGKIRVQRYLVLLTALTFVLLTVAILTVYRSPMTGYELSVYEATPIVFWIAIIACLLNGMLLFHGHYGTGRKMWAVGLFEILLAYFVLITLYLYKGFVYIERTDSMSYIGYAKDIVLQGSVPSSNFYPMISISMASTGEIVGQSMVLMSQLFTAIFYIAYIVGILCWSRAICPKPQFVTSMFLISLPILFAWFIPTLFHETLCVLMLPLFFFILWKGVGNALKLKLLAAIMVVFMTLGHPLVAGGLLIFLTTIFLTERVTRSQPRLMSAYFVLFSLIVWLGWIILNSVMVNSLRLIIEQMLGIVGGVSTFGTASSQASQIGILSAVQSILLCTIDDLIFIFLALWMGKIIIGSGWRKHPATVMMTCFLGGAVFLITIVFFTFAHTPFRLINLNFVMIFTLPLVGFLLYTKRRNRKMFATRLITGLIVFCVALTVFTAYQDPLEGFPNASVTRAETEGFSWFLTDLGDRADSPDVRYHTIQTDLSRFSDLIYGGYYLQEHLDLRYNTVPGTPHLDSFLKSNATSGTDYLIISTYDIDAYTKTWAKVDKYNENDFRNLALSSSADHVYTNGGLFIYVRA